MAQKWTGEYPHIRWYRQLFCFFQSPVLYTGIEVNTNSNAKHSRKGRMTNILKDMEIEIIKKKNLEGLRDVRVT